MARSKALHAMGQFDRALDEPCGMQYAHNWYRGEDSERARAITAILERFDALAYALWRREAVEYYRKEIVLERARYGRNAALEAAARAAIKEYKAARAALRAATGLTNARPTQ